MFGLWLKADTIELAKFAGVGLLNTIVGLAIIYSLKWYLDWGDALANLVGYSVCITLGFLLNGRWTFERSSLNARHLVGYFLVAGVAYIMNLIVVLASMEMLHLPGDRAQLVGVPVFTLTSYLLNKIFVFSCKHSSL